MENKKVFFIGVVSLVIGAGVGYFGALHIAPPKNAPANFSAGQNFGNNGGGNRPNGGMTRQNGQPNDPTSGRGGFLMGQVAAKDATSLTLKMPDGSSKIVFYSDATTVGKIAPASIADVASGQAIRVNGKTNPDGSVSAQAIQLTPAQE